MYKAALASLAFTLAHGAAMPAAENPPTLSRQYDMQFENQSALQEAPVPGPVDGLNWKTSSPQFCGQACTVFPYSYPFDINFDPKTPSEISADYPGSKVAFFDLQSFASGCAGNQTYPPGATGHYLTLAINCTIFVEGWSGPIVNKPIATATFSYRPQPTIGRIGVPQAVQQLFTLPKSFHGLRNVRFTPSPDKAYPNYAGGQFYAVMDDVSYQTTNYTV